MATAAKGKTVAKKVADYRTISGIKDAFRALSESANNDAHDLIKGVLAYMQRNDLSVSAMQKEIKECSTGVLTYSDVNYFGMAHEIYEHAIGATTGTPRDVMKMATRLQRFYGKDDAIKQVRKLTRDGVAFGKWNDKDENGKSLYVPTEKERKEREEKKNGGKENAKKVEKRAATFDEIVLQVLSIIGKRPAEWRTTSQPAAVAELVAILSSVTESGEKAKPKKPRK